MGPPTIARQPRVFTYCAEVRRDIHCAATALTARTPGRMRAARIVRFRGCTTARRRVVQSARYRTRVPKA